MTSQQDIMSIMDKVLFRGKRISDGIWVYGFYIHRPQPVCIGHSHPYCIWVPANNPDETTTIVEVDPATIGQFTGVSDMNKRPIFEGDIVVDRTMVFRVIGQIIYNTDKAAFVFKNSVTEESLAKHRWLEIIGNIYDNSELLKEEDTSW